MVEMVVHIRGAVRARSQRPKKKNWKKFPEFS